MRNGLLRSSQHWCAVCNRNPEKIEHGMIDFTQLLELLKKRHTFAGNLS